MRKARRRRKFFGFCLSNTVKKTVISSVLKLISQGFPIILEQITLKIFSKSDFLADLFKNPPLVSDPGQTRGDS